MINLTPAELLMLHYADIFTDNNNRFQGFWNYRYNISDPQQLLSTLQRKGYIAEGDTAYQLQHLSTAEIKRHLSDNGLKTSGKKVDLIARLIANTDTNAVYNSLPHYYTLTDSGAVAEKTSEYNCVLYLHHNQSLDDYGLNINSVYRLLQGGDYKKAIANYLLAQTKPPYFVIAGIFAEIEDYLNAFVNHITDLRVFLEGQQHQFHDPVTAPVLAANIAKFIYPYENSLLRIPIGRLRPLHDDIEKLNYSRDQVQQRINEIIKQLAASQFFFTDSECALIIYSELYEDSDTLTAIYKTAEQRFKEKYSIN